MPDLRGIFQTVELGELIDWLERRRRSQEDGPTQEVWFDFGHFRPALTMHSYRGSYEQLGIGYVDQGDVPTLDTLIGCLQGANGATFHGWKGGAYVMGLDTPVWCEQWGDGNSTAIVGIHDVNFRTILKTDYVDH